MLKNTLGFSLMEALLTVLVLSVGLLGLGQLQVRLWAADGDLHTLADAYLLGENLLEISRSAWLPAGTTQTLIQQADPAIRATLEQPEPAAGDGPVTAFTTDVRWQRPSGNYSLSLDTRANGAIASGDARWLLPWQ